MSRKLTPEQIQEIRVMAEKKREAHRQVMAHLSLITMSPQLQMTTLMSSYKRGREDEILKLLEVHTTGSRRYELASEVMLFVYTHKDELPEAFSFMLQNNRLIHELETRIFDDKVPPFFTDENGNKRYPKFSKFAEGYMVKKTLEACEKADKLTDELDFLSEYTKDNPLSDVAQVKLIDYLFVTTGRDSVLDALQRFVLRYLERYKDICYTAQIRLIQSGNHELIMYYITHSIILIFDCEVIVTLIDRADEEEITAYYNRYAREE